MANSLARHYDNAECSDILILHTSRRVGALHPPNAIPKPSPLINHVALTLKNMQPATSPLSPDIWLNDLFASKAVQQGGVIRRKARDIERFVGMDRFMAEIHRRGYQVAENAGQVIIFCNREPVRWITSADPLS